ncbi:PEP/pyruvate-binding domain-containing protein [Hymenobacter latericus]|uniref:PEP/pyruvate-binding domain-containing protein n=1 Tax=Hymenobacter sp. YIM 151858-1 TaxID=2987688 RepID=UPI002227E0AD|nr:PEP/pyruvate-binding domain-containing protein [Hymenobacter sp. YIM 151858-1]UYZ59482.1 PEP-utilizing enzyme [Hymenobacter sp. YIM 151858-1]
MILTSAEPQPPRHAVGGKAAGLYRLQATGMRVPDFVVLPAEQFDALFLGISTDEAGLQRRREKLLHFRLGEAERSTLSAQLQQWNFPQQPVVVRSSVADEDGQQAAFAGLMDTFMNLTTPEEVEQAIARCAASAYSERAVAYRRQKGLPLAARPAVIVQRQITPAASGVLFSTFPEYPQELAVHAVWGFGEGLVSGALAPDEFYFSKQTGQVHRQTIASKDQQYVARPAGGLLVQAVPPPLQHEPCLSAAHLGQLFGIGTQLEQALGGPQDVEFVVAGEQLWVVQARPITQPIPEVVVYDNSNIQESYCGVTTPLTFSFAQRAYATVYRQTMHALGLPAAQIAAQEPVITQLLGLVKGRIYYNINNWYRGLQLLPSFRQNKADMERMMGLEEPVDFVQTQEKTLAAKLRMAPRLVLNLSRLLWAFSRLNEAVRAFHARFEQHYRRFYRLQLSRLSADALLAEKKRLDDELLGNWSTPIVNDFYVMMTNGRAVRQLQQAGAPEPEALLRRYLAGDQDLASTQPTKHMLALAEQVRPNAALRQLILAQRSDLPAQVQQLAPAFAEQVAEFISRYGDRTVGELKLETQTMRTNPQIFYQYLRNYLTAEAPATLGTHGSQQVLGQAQAEVEALLQGKSWVLQRQVRRQLRQLQQAIRHRESLRLERTRLFGMYRALYLAIGVKLAAAGLLQEPRQIFYLTEDEATSTLKDGFLADLPATLATRQQEFSAYQRADVPARVVVPSPPLTPAEHDETSEAAMRGTGCYPGQASGEVLVITSPEDNLGVAGKIVCALRTDPGWAALFPACRAVIIEKGSSLSHSVILLRELGIPTIINVPGITKRLRSGQFVRLDGATGEIELM